MTDTTRLRQAIERLKHMPCGPESEQQINIAVIAALELVLAAQGADADLIARLRRRGNDFAEVQGSDPWEELDIEAADALAASALFRTREGARSQIRPIRTEADHKAALARIDTLMGAELNTPEGEELDVLTDLVRHYESKSEAGVTVTEEMVTRGLDAFRSTHSTDRTIIRAVLEAALSAAPTPQPRDPAPAGTWAKAARVTASHQRDHLIENIREKLDLDADLPRTHDPAPGGTVTEEMVARGVSAAWNIEPWREVDGKDIRAILEAALTATPLLNDPTPGPCADRCKMARQLGDHDPLRAERKRADESRARWLEEAERATVAEAALSRPAPTREEIVKIIRATDHEGKEAIVAADRILSLMQRGGAR